MPAKKKTRTSRATKATKTTKAAKASRPSIDLRCKDCGFVAAHPMGLGRHRSTRHGAISKRAARGVAAARAGVASVWITRQQAAERAGVHYNTIRQWERSGALRKGSNPGARETLVSAADVMRLAATRGGPVGGGEMGLTAVDAARLSAIERTQRDLADGLERLAAALRAGVAPAPAKASTTKKVATRKVATKKVARKTAVARAPKAAKRKAPTRAPKKAPRKAAKPTARAKRRKR